MAKIDSKPEAAAAKPKMETKAGAKAQSRPDDVRQSGKPEAMSVPIRPTWDDSAMQSAYANVCNVTGSREEITLLFGTNQAWQSDNGALAVKLSHRIVLTPYTAKRLAQMLDQGVREYEQRFGEIKLS